MQPKPTKADLLIRIQELEKDNEALSSAIIKLENDMEFLHKLIAESYNPYNSARPLLMKKTPIVQEARPVTDNSITVNIKR
jgi:hypothetical protein